MILYDNPSDNNPDLSLHLEKNYKGPITQLKYTKIIASLLYLMNYSCLNIAYAINKLSWIMSSQVVIIKDTNQGTKTLTRALRYLENT